MPNVRIVVGALNDEFAERCTDICTENQIEVFSARTQELMSVATVCIACSGSVCLELLWHRVPTVVVYKITWLKYWLQSVVLQCKFITLTNLMTESDIRKTNWWPYDPDAVDAQPVLVPEYLSPRDCSDGITKKIIAWLSSKELLADNRDKLEQLAERYANPGATSRAADYIMTTLPAAKRKPAAA